MAAQYRNVEAQVDLVAMEHQILDFWRENDVFTKSLDATEGGPTWTFYEGPPTANGTPGTHHVEARVFKDVFPRFKTMQGYRVDRRAGWDCHGLPVELAVEKELGFNGKPDIEAFGIEPFNARCRESVHKHVQDFADLTERMGYWVNLDEAYWTMNPAYVESVWWALKQIHEAGLLSEDYRVAPYCPRCGTTLSDHELAQGYEDVKDPSVYIRMPLVTGPHKGANLLVWTTTPWTLVSNTAVAVHPDVDYLVLANADEQMVIAEPLAQAVLGFGNEDSEWQLVDKLVGRDMEGWAYQCPFDYLDFGDTGKADTPTGAHIVVLADYVTTSDGTGLVHQAPAFGADDMVVCREYGLPMVNPIAANGSFADEVPEVGGLFFKSADPMLVKDLDERGLLFRELEYEHAYPHCWRCHTALLYYAQPSWYIRTTQIQEQLLAQNAQTNWYPAHIRDGRFGDWLNNNVDWALSRKRYWGTPLPIWRCADDHQVCVGSRAELSKLTGRDYSDLDPHRPFVDDVVFDCPTCGAESRRVPEVIDAWFDSGSMPFAQLGYPWKQGSEAELEKAYPADFICEAIDQTRGWFYTLMAVGTLVFEQSSYRNVLCLGHILAEDGRKMSKHLGNILPPIPLMDAHGADAVRWFMLAGGSPWSARRVGHTAIQETVRKVLLTYWNTVAFQVLYAKSNDWTPIGEAPSELHILDRWLVSAREKLVADVTKALDNFDTQGAGVLLWEFIDDLSNWYVRRSRRRFWDGEPSALWTLHETLNTVTRLMAPLMPFITERVWQDMFVATDPSAPESVHLASWPESQTELIDADLVTNMKLTRRLVELGRSARAEAKVKIRQPLRRLLIPSASLARLTDELVNEIRSELNIQTVESFSSAGDLVEYSAKGNFRNLGKRFGKRTPQIAAAIAAAPAAELAAAVNNGGTYEVEGETISADDVIISERPLEGWSVVNEQGETVALDLELTEELRLAGLAREVIRFLQETRKTSGLHVSDRIKVVWAAEGDVASAVRAHTELIATEVLAVEMAEGAPTQATATEDDLKMSVQIEKTAWPQ